MADNKVGVEINIEDVAAMKALENLSKKINKAATMAIDMGLAMDKGFEQSSKSATQIGESFKVNEKMISAAEKAFTDGLNNTSKYTKASAAEVKSYEDRVKAAEDASKGFFQNLSEGASLGFGGLVKGVTIANLATDAITGVMGSIRDFALNSINAAVENEQAINRLNQALRSSGGYSVQAVSEFSAFADQLESISTLSGPAILEQIALAKSMGATNAEAKSLTLASANLSAQFGGPLDSNTKALGQTLNGVLGKLGKEIPELKKFTTEQLRAGAAIEFINSKFEGATKGSVRGYAGEIDLLGKGFGKFQEELGGFITKSPIVLSALHGLGEGFKAMAAGVAAARSTMGIGLTQYEETKTKIRDLGQEFNSLVSLLESKKKALQVEVNYGGGDESSLERQKNMQLQIIEMESKRTLILQERAKLRQSMISMDEQEDTTPARTRSDEAINKEKESLIEIAKLKEEFQIAEMETQALLDSQKTETREIELQKVYEFEALKLEAAFQAEEAKAKLIKDSSDRDLRLREIQAKREVEFTKLSNNQIKAENQKSLADEKAYNSQMLGATSNFLSSSEALVRQGSNAQKALQITQATINSYTAFSNALADTRPAAAAPFVAASVLAMGLANVSKIMGAKFATGGIVDSTSKVGDQNMIRVNGGEAVLTEAQQQRFMEIANGTRSAGNGNIEALLTRLINAIESQDNVVSIDGREIARSLREQKDMGYSI